MLKVIAETGEVPQWKFAREHAVAVETLSRHFATLRRKKSIAVRTGTNHGDQIYMLTEQGRDVFLRARPYWERAQRRLGVSLGQQESRLLLHICDRVVNAAKKAEQLRAINSAA